MPDQAHDGLLRHGIPMKSTFIEAHRAKLNVIRVGRVLQVSKARVLSRAWGTQIARRFAA
jgi:hypothetical protein